MRYFTKEELDMLKPAEPYFKQVQQGYKHYTPNKMNDLVGELYERVSGKSISHNWGCSHCLKTAFELCGKIYFDSINHYENEKIPEGYQKAEMDGKEIFVKFEKIEENKKRVGRPRKNG